MPQHGMPQASSRWGSDRATARNSWRTGGQMINSMKVTGIPAADETGLPNKRTLVIPLDLQSVVNRRPELRFQILCVFMHATARRLQKLHEAWKLRSTEDICNQARQLASAADEAGASRLSYLAATLETSARDGRGHCGLLIQSLENEFSHIQSEMDHDEDPPFSNITAVPVHANPSR